MKFSQSSTATERRKKVGFVAKTGQTPERGERFFGRSIFCRPIRGLNIFQTNNSTVAPWATFLRASGALAAMVLFFASGATAETTNTMSAAEIQGRQLAQQLCEAQPAENLTNTGHLLIRHKDSPRVDLPFQFRVIAGPSNWQATYETIGESYHVKFLIIHDAGRNQFFEIRNDEKLMVEPTMPFAGSDFSLGDLGLEFFHWPQQKVLKKEFHRQCGCTVLESTNPNPSANGYSRVVSWIDAESHGIVEADAYDVSGKKIKNFYPKNLKKVNGQYQVETMIIKNLQTESTTRLEFDLKKSE